MSTVGHGAEVDLGNGHRARFVSQPDGAIPVGILEYHGACRVFVPWAGDTDRLWDLLSLVPLSIDPGVVCPSCGATIVIRDGEVVQP